MFFTKAIHCKEPAEPSSTDLELNELELYPERREEIAALERMMGLRTAEGNMLRARFALAYSRRRVGKFLQRTSSRIATVLFHFFAITFGLCVLSGIAVLILANVAIQAVGKVCHPASPGRRSLPSRRAP